MSAEHLVEIAEAPGWLVDLASKPREHEPDPKSRAKKQPAKRDALLDGGTTYGLAALEGEIERVRTASDGTRNDTLNKAAFALAQLVAGEQLDESRAKSALFDAALAAGLDKQEIAATLRSGWRAGLREPRRPEPPPPRKVKGAAPADGSDDYVLVPGQHAISRTNVIEVGTDDFAAAVLGKLPEGALYRWDHIVGLIVGEPGARKFVELSQDRMRLLIDQHVSLARMGRR